MARGPQPLPEYDRRLVTTEAPRVAVDREAIASGGKALAQAFGLAGEMLETAGLAAQEQMGAKAVSMDADGNPQVENRVILSRADVAYQRGAETGFAAAQETRVRSEINELGNRYLNNPEGFGTAAQAFEQELLSNYNGENYLTTQRMTRQLIGEKQLGLMKAKTTRDMVVANDAIDAARKEDELRLQNFAWQGGLDTPEAQETLSRYYNRSIEQAGNPLLQKSRESIELEFRGFKANLAVNSILGKVDREYREDPVKAQEYARGAFNDPKLDLTPGERMEGIRKAESLVETQTTSQRLAAQEHRLEVVTPLYNTLTQTRAPVDVRQVSRAIETARGMKDYASVAKLEQALEIRQVIGPGSVGSGAGAPEGLRSVISGAAQRYGVSEAGLMRTAQLESRFDPDANKGNRKGAKGLFQFMEETAGQYGVADRFDAGQSADGAARLWADNANVLRKDLGREPSDAEVYLAHQQGAGGASKLLANPGEPAWRVVGREAVAQNLPDSMKGRAASMTAGEFANLWINKFNGTGKGTSGPGVATPLSPAVYLEIVQSAQKRLPQMLSQGEELLKNSRGFGDDFVMALQEQARLVNDPVQTEKMLGQLVANQALQMRVNTPSRADPRVTQTVIDAFKNGKLNGMPMGTEAAVQMAGKYVQQAEEVRQKKLAEDPISVGVEGGYVVPGNALAWHDDDAARATSERRKMELYQVEAREGVDRPSFFRPQEKDAITREFAGTAEQAGRATAFLADVPDQFFEASVKDVKDGLRAAMASADPRKHQLMMGQVDRMWMRAPTTVAAALGDDGMDLLQDWQAKRRWMPDVDLAADLQKRWDPGQIKKQKELQTEARTILRKNGGTKYARVEDRLNTIVGKYDAGLFDWGPSAPMDEGTRNAMLDHYESVFVDRWARTQDEEMSHEQALQRTMTVFGRSNVAGNRVMMYPPEQTYDMDAATMKTMAERDFRIAIGRVPENYSFVADSVTEGEINGGKPASYMAVEQRANGMVDLVRDAKGTPLRMYWDKSKARVDAREQFARQRNQVLASRKGETKDLGLIDMEELSRYSREPKGGVVGDDGLPDGLPSVLPSAADAARARQSMPRISRKARDAAKED